MKNSLIDNQGLSLPNKKKTKLASQIEQLKVQEQQITKQLKSWQSKQDKANNFLNQLCEIDRFGNNFLTESLAFEKNKTNPDSWWLEYLITNKVEFAFKFAFGKEAFTKLILEKTARQVSSLKSELNGVQSQISHQERKFVRLQARRQGKTLLECKLNNGLGCLGVYQCDNCQVNYSAFNSVQTELKGGAY